MNEVGEACANDVRRFNAATGREIERKENDGQNGVDASGLAVI
jgi:hypothetical protein